MGIMRAALRFWGDRAHDIGDFQSRLLLTVFYFTLLVPFALLRRLFGAPLGLDRRTAGTTWRQGLAGDARIESARRQF